MVPPPPAPAAAPPPLTTTGNSNNNNSTDGKKTEAEDNATTVVPQPRRDYGRLAAFVAAKTKALDTGLLPTYFFRPGPHGETRKSLFGAMVFGVLYIMMYFCSPPVKDLHDDQVGLGVFLWWHASVFVQGDFANYIVLPMIIQYGCRAAATGKISAIGAFLRQSTTIIGGDAVSVQQVAPAAAIVPRPAQATPSAASSAAAAESREEVVVVGGGDAVDAGLFLDAEGCSLGGKWCLLYVCIMWPCVRIFKDEGGAPLGFLIEYLIGINKLLRPTANRWNPDAAPIQIRALWLRQIITLMPVALLPFSVVPPLVKSLPVTSVLSLYPLLLSVIECCYVSLVWNEKAAAPITDEQLAFFTRDMYSVLEASRVGMLVVVSNFYDDFWGLLQATILSALLDTAARYNLFVILKDAVLYSLGRLPEEAEDDGGEGARRTGFLSRINRPLTRAEAIYLACKGEAQLYPFYMLVLNKLVGNKLVQATAPATGELLPALDCSWVVLAVVLLGEVATFLLTTLLGRWMDAYAPELKVRVPRSVSFSNSPVVNTLVYVHVAIGCFMVIGGMGTLVDALVELEKDKLGV